jgi:excisionase family DNA binding protein
MHDVSQWTPADLSVLTGPDWTLVTVGTASRVLSLGRSKVFELLHSGEIRSMKIGASRRISIGAIFP